VNVRPELTSDARIEGFAFEIEAIHRIVAANQLDDDIVHGLVVVARTCYASVQSRPLGIGWRTERGVRLAAISFRPSMDGSDPSTPAGRSVKNGRGSVWPEKLAQQDNIYARTAIPERAVRSYRSGSASPSDFTGRTRMRQSSLATVGRPTSHLWGRLQWRVRLLRQYLPSR